MSAQRPIVKTLDISYAQLAVFQSSLAEPFNAWTDAHLAQGFAWRDGSVSFVTVESSGPIEVEVCQAGPAGSTSTASRVISVPFTVGNDCAVEVASISDGVVLEMNAGEYRLTFEHGLGEAGTMWCRLWFERVLGSVEPKVERAGDDLVPVGPLRMDAEPAR